MRNLDYLHQQRHQLGVNTVNLSILKARLIYHLYVFKHQITALFNKIIKTLYFWTRLRQIQLRYLYYIFAVFYSCVEQEQWCSVWPDGLRVKSLDFSQNPRFCAFTKEVAWFLQNWRHNCLGEKGLKRPISVKKKSSLSEQKVDLE